MDEAGFVLRPLPPCSYVVQRYELIYCLEEVTNGYKLEFRDRGEKQADDLHFASITELEGWLTKRLQDFIEARRKEI